MKNCFLFLSLLAAIKSSGQLHYPPVPRADSTETYFGVTYHDPYRWLEHIQTADVQQWFRAQASLTDSVLGSLPGRNALVAEYTRLDSIRPVSYRDLVYRGGRLFYKKTAPGEKVGKIYYREGLYGNEVLLFDPLHYSAGKTLSVDDFVPSFDGKKLAIGYSQLGAEVPVVKIMNVSEKRFTADSLYPAMISSWTFDNEAILYRWIRSADNKDPQSRLSSKIRLHRLGTSAAADRDFLSSESYPELNIQPAVYPVAFVSEDAPQYLFGGEYSVAPELKMYYAPIGQMNGKVAWKPLCNPEDKLVNSIVFHDGRVYAISSKGARNYRLLSTSLQQPDWNGAQVIVAEDSGKTIEDIYGLKDYLLIVKSDGINSYLYTYHYGSRQLKQATLPFQGGIRVSVPDPKSNFGLVMITSWVKPLTEFAFDPLTGLFSPGPFEKPAAYPAAYNELVIDEVLVRGHDGVMIPLSIIHRKDFKRDGSAVCLMEGYGAYGNGISSGLDLRQNALAVQGAVIAIAHVRGGGEKGEAWYRAGYQTTKPNTWKDFISCADYLCEKGYTSPGKIGGLGTSAGGILITRAITERPDLFGAAICNVGCANAMRLEFSANGPVNIPEFGTVTDSAQCRALYEMDGMQHVQNGLAYPAVICVAGWTDPRVVPWQPGKFAAAMQHASTSGRPVLMKVNYDNGHFTEDKTVTNKNFADMYAFVMWQCGHPNFQQKR